MTEDLPELPEGLAERLLDGALRSGRAHLCDTDEAELRAIGYTPPGRGPDADTYLKAMAPMDDPDIIAAGQRLVHRGLASAEPTSRAVVTASAELLMYLRSVLIGAPVGLVSCRPARDAGADTHVRRLHLLAGTVEAPLALVESSEVPVDPPAGPLPVRLELVRHDVLVGDLTALAIPGTAGQLHTGVVLRARYFPAEILADGDAAVLTTPGHGLRHNQKKSRQTSPADLQSFLLKSLNEVAGAK